MRRWSGICIVIVSQCQLHIAEHIYHEQNKLIVKDDELYFIEVYLTNVHAKGTKP